MEILDYPAEESFRALYLLVSRVSRFLLCPVSVMPCVLRSKLLFPSFEFCFSSCTSIILDSQLSRETQVKVCPYFFHAVVEPYASFSVVGKYF